ncbi:DUF1349 domain-containing protein [Leptospira sp. 201903071]|uniref:DUF1349 domain-containing protein n=1 Tax=Leptospira ainazelensis TaxID=2810034 RepID=UPI001966AA74|nr:DUF1349 domain-containing protein [Leptospira ainazelensis]MBM9500195.1 DUF1349 domain-containing protein [Leptospira ainazelensis]
MFNEKKEIEEGFFWYNIPDFQIQDRRLFLKTSPETDFWQRTHYGFRKDNGHCLLRYVVSDFSLSVRTEFFPKKQYDQCGLMVRIDSENWIKSSIEYETPSHSRLGSVVTNFGYSDWATLDILNEVRSMWYRIQSRGNDVILEYSENEMDWNQIRIAHLHSFEKRFQVGIYACSPMDSSFECIFDHFCLGTSEW